MKSLKAIKELENNVTHIILQGEVDYVTYPDLRKLFSKLISEGKNKLIIDLMNITYIDSSGLGAIASAHVKVNSVGGFIKLINSKPDTKKILDIAGISKVIPVFTDLKSACG